MTQKWIVVAQFGQSVQRYAWTKSGRWTPRHVGVNDGTWRLYDTEAEAKHVVREKRLVAARDPKLYGAVLYDVEETVL